jgi:hypothetical protein
VKQHMLLVTRSDDPDYPAMQRALEAVAERHRGRAIFIVMHANRPDTKEAVDYLKIDQDDLPALLLMDWSRMHTGNKWWFPPRRAVTARNVLNWAGTVFSGAERPVIKADGKPVVNKGKGGVLAVTGDTFVEKVLLSEKHVLLEMYDGSGYVDHSSYWPAYETLAAKVAKDKGLKGEVVVARIDYYNNEIDHDLAPASAGLPLFKLFPAGGGAHAKPVSYRGAKTVPGWTKFLLRAVKKLGPAAASGGGDGSGGGGGKFNPFLKSADAAVDAAMAGVVTTTTTAAAVVAATEVTKGGDAGSAGGGAGSGGGSGQEGAATEGAASTRPASKKKPTATKEASSSSAAAAAAAAAVAAAAAAAQASPVPVPGAERAAARAVPKEPLKEPAAVTAAKGRVAAALAASDYGLVATLAAQLQELVQKLGSEQAAALRAREEAATALKVRMAAALEAADYAAVAALGKEFAALEKAGGGGGGGSGGGSGGGGGGAEPPRHGGEL